MVFANGKIFILDCADGLRYYWNNLLNEPYLLSKRVQGGGSILIWAGFIEKTSFVSTKTKINWFNYQDVLGNNFVPFKDELMDQKLELLQDKASIYKYVSTSDWLSANEIKILAIPVKSPAINPIENMWESWFVKFVPTESRLIRLLN